MSTGFFNVVFFSNTFLITSLYIPLKLNEPFYDVSVMRIGKKTVNGNFVDFFFSTITHIFHIFYKKGKERKKEYILPKVPVMKYLTYGGG